MKSTLLILSALTLVAFASSAFAGGTGYSSFTGSCATSKFQTPRYHQSLPFRHYDDVRRYNAAPCCGEVVHTNPYLVKTVVVRKKREPHYYIDSSGRERCHKVLVTTYKAIYSDGSCRVWTTHG
ncbi:MAG: hypothetical protein AAGC68_04155 [Verrucomicrobiota bacterium]